MQDIREELFRKIRTKRFRAVVTPERSGVLSGVSDAARAAEECGCEWISQAEEGDILAGGVSFAEITGTPIQLAMAEEKVIGTMAKMSGIATAARHAVTEASGRIEIVSGAWKKMPPAVKEQVRRAVRTGGARFRICDPPMLYIDKNFVAMFGSVGAALEAASGMKDRTICVQIKGHLASAAEETLQAVKGGAGVIMVDTGDLRDLRDCLDVLNKLDVRRDVRLAFAGNLKIADIQEMCTYDIDLLDIGREIIDAEILDMRIDVRGTVEDA